MCTMCMKTIGPCQCVRDGGVCEYAASSATTDVYGQTTAQGIEIGRATSAAIIPLNCPPSDRHILTINPLVLHNNKTLYSLYTD